MTVPTTQTLTTMITHVGQFVITLALWHSCEMSQQYQTTQNKIYSFFCKIQFRFLRLNLCWFDIAFVWRQVVRLYWSKHCSQSITLPFCVHNSKMYFITKEGIITDICLEAKVAQFPGSTFSIHCLKWHQTNDFIPHSLLFSFINLHHQRNQSIIFDTEILQ